MSDALLIALVGSGSIATLALDRGITWLRNRGKDDAEAGLTVDQRWQQLADKYEERIDELEERIGKVENSLKKEQGRSKGLEAEVDRYKSIARSLLRHVIRLREALATQGVEAPPIPPDIEDAMTTIDLP